MCLVDTGEIRLARQRHSSSERHEGHVVSVRLTKMWNESLNMEAELPKEKIRRVSDCYIRQVNTLDERSLRSSNVMYKAFR